MKKLLKNLTLWLTYKLANFNTDYKMAAASGDMANAMWEFQQYLRNQTKYGDPPDDAHDIYKNWFENLNDNNIDLDRLIL